MKKHSIAVSVQFSLLFLSVVFFIISYACGYRVVFAPVFAVIMSCAATAVCVATAIIRLSDRRAEVPYPLNILSAAAAPLSVLYAFLIFASLPPYAESGVTLAVIILGILAVIPCVVSSVITAKPTSLKAACIAVLVLLVPVVLVYAFGTVFYYGELSGGCKATVSREFTAEDGSYAEVYRFDYGDHDEVTVFVHDRADVYFGVGRLVRRGRELWSGEVSKSDSIRFALDAGGNISVEPSVSE